MHLDGLGDLLVEPGRQTGDFEGGADRRRQKADRGARLQAGRHADQRQVVPRGQLGEAPARGHADRPAAARQGARDAGERLFGVARVAHRQDQRALGHPGRQLVAAHDLVGHGQTVETGADDVGADRRAAHAADDDAVRPVGGHEPLAGKAATARV